MHRLGTVGLALALLGATPAHALTKSENAAIMHSLMSQIRPCLAPPHPLQSGKVVIGLRVAGNGTVSDLQVVEPQPLTETNQAIVQAALRAVQRCAPFRLPAEFSASFRQPIRLKIQLVFN